MDHDANLLYQMIGRKQVWAEQLNAQNIELRQINDDIGTANGQLSATVATLARRVQELEEQTADLQRANLELGHQCASLAVDADTLRDLLADAHSAMTYSTNAACGDVSQERAYTGADESVT